MRYITEANRCLLADQKTFNKYHDDVDKALVVKQLLAAVPAIYLEGVDNADYWLHFHPCW